MLSFKLEYAIKGGFVCQTNRFVGDRKKVVSAAKRGLIDLCVDRVRITEFGIHRTALYWTVLKSPKQQPVWKKTQRVG